MRVHRTTAALAITVALLASGCSGNASNQAAAGLMSVEVGMSESQVLAIMGPPQRRESQGGTEFLIYASDDRSATALLDFIPIAMEGASPGLVGMFMIRSSGLGRGPI